MQDVDGYRHTQIKSNQNMYISYYSLKKGQIIGILMRRQRSTKIIIGPAARGGAEVTLAYQRQQLLSMYFITSTVINHQSACQAS